MRLSPCCNETLHAKKQLRHDCFVTGQVCLLLTGSKAGAIAAGWLSFLQKLADTPGQTDVQQADYFPI